MAKIGLFFGNQTGDRQSLDSLTQARTGALRS
jgi:hypothetical protein